jgi:hypothetical protein
MFVGTGHCLARSGRIPTGRRHVKEPQKATTTVSEFRELIGTSRKYAVPLLEYLDSIRFTRREGDQRVLAS